MNVAPPAKAQRHLSGQRPDLAPAANQMGDGRAEVPRTEAPSAGAARRSGSVPLRIQHADPAHPHQEQFSGTISGTKTR